MICYKCGKKLRAFHYYRDNACFVYCEECGKTYQACYAAPYRTIELKFSACQQEGFSFTLEIEKWPSLEYSYLHWKEWNWSGGVDSKVHLPSNYLSEHTMDEFIDEFILKENEATKHISPLNQNSLNDIRIALEESVVFRK